MTLRCGCYDQADDIVFGPRHQCTSKPAMAVSSRLDAVNDYLQGRLPSPVVAAIYDLARDVREAAKATQADFTLSPPDECDGMDSPVDQLDLERRTNPYDMDDAERGGY